MATEWSTGDAAEVCELFQLDLSCLVDGEIDESAAARALVHLETCDLCREFFDDTRRCLRMHRDIADPERLLARISSLTGAELAAVAGEGSLRADGIELVHKLATIFYQLGKAYVLAGTDPDYLRTRVFEDAVPLESTQSEGRGFVDGVLLSGKAEKAGLHGGEVDWKHARAMLNGRLKEIESPIEKGRRLLEEAIAADPAHEEARVYLAYLHAQEGKKLVAAREFGEIFVSAISEANRAHAAVQLGQLHVAEGDYRKAIAYFRWVSISGVEERDDRFFVVLFNLGVLYALLRDQRRSLGYFRRLLDRHPARVDDVARLVASATNLRQAFEEQPGFAEKLVTTCPELFEGSEGSTGGGAHA